jgi:hypothetical protein
MHDNQNKKIIFLGDIHGEFNIIFNVCKKYPKYSVISIGDVGLGFPKIINFHTGKPFKQDPKKFPNNFKFIRGNHCNPIVSKLYPNYLGDYGYNKELDLFFISGAWSIDVNLRIPGEDWWYEEELDYPELQKAIDLYKKIKPKIVVSHTCPSVIARIICPPPEYYGSKTESALGYMFNEHKPKYWIFGHWHREWQKNILGTEFICLDINQTVTLDI